MTAEVGGLAGRLVGETVHPNEPNALTAQILDTTESGVDVVSEINDEYNAGDSADDN